MIGLSQYGTGYCIPTVNATLLNQELQVGCRANGFGYFSFLSIVVMVATLGTLFTWQLQPKLRSLFVRSVKKASLLL